MVLLLVFIVKYSSQFCLSNHSPFCYIRYESIIATLCENLDSLDEPDAEQL